MAVVVRVVRIVLLVGALIFLFNAVWTLFDGSDKAGGTFVMSWACNDDAQCHTSQPGTFTGNDMPKAIGNGAAAIGLALLSIGLSPALWGRAGTGPARDAASPAAGYPQQYGAPQQAGYQQAGYPAPGQPGSPGSPGSAAPRAGT